MLLGDLGADVIKVEKPGESSMQRNVSREALFSNCCRDEGLIFFLIR